MNKQNRIAPVSTTVAVSLGNRSYGIEVGRGLLARAAELVAPVLQQKRVFIVTDSNVAPLYLGALEGHLASAGIRCDHLILPAGEASKDFTHLTQVLDAMLAAKCERSTMVVALGGGVVGDMAGFAASVLLRGVDFIQMPTTLLAQVDSAVGGKTGINTKAGKNLVGAFHQPRLVLADTDTLETLPRRELLAGYAEVAKYGLLGDAAFWSWLESNGATALSGTAAGHDGLRHCIVTACEAKARIVAADEREQGERILLNLGHTFGHAFEAGCGYSQRLLHGEAVALGCVMAFQFSERQGLLGGNSVARVRSHLADAGLPTKASDVEGGVPDVDRLMDLVAQDKKVKRGKLAFILARGIGEAFVAGDVDPAEVRAFLQEKIAE